MKKTLLVTALAGALLSGSVFADMPADIAKNKAANEKTQGQVDENRDTIVKNRADADHRNQDHNAEEAKNASNAKHAQDTADTNTKGVADNKAANEKTQGQVDDNSGAIASNNAQIDKNDQNTKKNAAAAKGAQDTADHNSGEIADNARNTYINAQRGERNSNDIATNKAGIATNKAGIADNKKSIGRLKKGMALNTALAGLKYHGSSIAMAYGNNMGASALAIGGSYALTRQFSVNAGTAYNGQIAANVGCTYSFN